MSDLTNLSDEELMEQWTVAGDAATEAKEVAKSYAQEFERRETEKIVTAKLEGMTDSERAAMAELSQTFVTEGIASEEAVGESNESEDEGVIVNG